MGTEKIILDKAKDIQKEDTRYVTSKLEEEYKLADGTMLEVRRHEFHTNEQAAKNYKMENKKAPVKSMTGKKAKEKLQAQMEELEATKAEWREKYDAGDRDHFILHGKLVDKTKIENSELSEAMLTDVLLHEEALAMAEDLKAKIDKLNPMDEVEQTKRLRLAYELRELYSGKKIELKDSTREFLKENYQDYNKIIEESNPAFIENNGASYEGNIRTLRSKAGRYKKKETGELYYTDNKKKYTEEQRNKYKDDEAYYDYVLQLHSEMQTYIKNHFNLEEIKQRRIAAFKEEIEYRKRKREEERIENPDLPEYVYEGSIFDNTINVEHAPDELDAVEDKFYKELLIFHLHKAKEYNRKIDLEKWAAEERDQTGNVIFLSNEPIDKTKPMKPLT